MESEIEVGECQWLLAEEGRVMKSMSGGWDFEKGVSGYDDVAAVARGVGDANR